MSSAVGTLAFRLLLLFSVIGCGFGAFKAKMIDEHTSKQMTNSVSYTHLTLPTTPYV